MHNPNILLAEATFLSTRIKEEYEQIINSTSNEPDLDCLKLHHPDCRYGATNLTTYYIGEPELFTAWIDHSISVPGLDESKAAVDMNGKLTTTVGGKHVEIDPCRIYNERQIPCPSLVKFGYKDKDIIPIQAFLDAAGIESMD